MRRSSAALAILLLAGGCQPGSGNDPVPLDRFAGAYAGLLEVSRTQQADSPTRQHSIDSVLAAHGMDRAAFRAGVEWYNEDVVRWKEVLEEVVRQLERTHAPAAVRPSIPGAPSSP